ncbi:unnamed protein product [Acidithrix sp. C25]|nr:unnamed protein product [Acidithrix sp. C25]
MSIEDKKGMKLTTTQRWNVIESKTTSYADKAKDNLGFS